MYNKELKGLALPSVAPGQKHIPRDLVQRFTRMTQLTL